MDKRRSDHAAIEAEIDRVRSLGLDALRKQWRSTFGASTPTGLTKDIIARMICHRLQEETFGGLDRVTIRLLDSLVSGSKPDELKRRLKPGTVLFREYNGERHTVTVAPGGFVWRGTPYSNLSSIARAITGTAWNGPRFFGLRGKTTSNQNNGSKQPVTKVSYPARDRCLPRAASKASRREIRR